MEDKQNFAYSSTILRFNSQPTENSQFGMSQDKNQIEDGTTVPEKVLLLEQKSGVKIPDKDIPFSSGVYKKSKIMQSLGEDSSRKPNVAFKHSILMNSQMRKNPNAHLSPRNLGSQIDLAVKGQNGSKESEKGSLSLNSTGSSNKDWLLMGNLNTESDAEQAMHQRIDEHIGAMRQGHENSRADFDHALELFQKKQEEIEESQKILKGVIEDGQLQGGEVNDTLQNIAEKSKELNKIVASHDQHCKQIKDTAGAASKIMISEVK